MRVRRGSAGGGEEERRRSAARKWWCGDGGEECRQWRTAKARSSSGRRRAWEEWCRRWSRRRSAVRGCHPSGVVTAGENDGEGSPAAAVDGIGSWLLLELRMRGAHPAAAAGDMKWAVARKVNRPVGLISYSACATQKLTYTIETQCQ